VSTPIQDISLTTIDGQPSSLADYQGKVLLLVNVASKCGLTPQYEGLQALYAEKHAQGLEVLGFPANNFLGQEPGSEAEIQQFCQLTYDVSFPMFSKISVAGEDTHPLYQQLTAAQPQSIGEGPLRERLASKEIPIHPHRRCCGTSRSSWSAATARSSPASPDVAADDARLREAIEAALAA
jgi:glutathione peroxidase